MFKSFLVATLLIVSATFILPAQAEILFSKTRLILHPIALDQLPAYNGTPRVVMTRPIELPAELRAAQSFQTPSLYLTQTLQGNDAYLVELPVKSSDDVAQIEPANVYAPVDLLAINTQGIVTQIWPQLRLSELTKKLDLPSGSRAVLYLAANRAAQLGIAPKTRIEHRLFSPPPTSIR